MKFDAKTFDKWKEWCKTIDYDITTLFHYKQINEYFGKVVNNNRKHIQKNNGIAFCNFVHYCYGVQAALGVRRQVKHGRKKEITLRRLLGEIEYSADLFTFEFYLEQYPRKNNEPWQEITFKLFSDNGESISSGLIQRHIKELEDGCKRTEEFVDKHLAHIDRDRNLFDLTFNDIEQSLDLVAECANKYITLITSANRTGFAPVIQFNWREIFRVPFDIQSQGDSIDDD